MRSSPPTNAEFDVHEGPAGCAASRQGSSLEFLCNSLRGDTRFSRVLTTTGFVREKKEMQEASSRPSSFKSEMDYEEEGRSRRRSLNHLCNSF